MIDIAAVALLGLALTASACASTSYWDTGASASGVDGTDATRSINAYHGAVKRKVIRSFEGLSAGDPSYALSLMRDDVVYTFAGAHALGGTREDKAAVTKWFDRLVRLLPGKFEILAVEVSGGPSDTRVYVRFRDTVSPEYGQTYVNQGFQTLRLSWGKVVRVETFVDTAQVQAALDTLAAAGVVEAHAPAIER